jgi:hypothetical protein
MPWPARVGLRQAARQLGIHRDALKAAFAQWGLPALQGRHGSRGCPWQSRGSSRVLQITCQGHGREAGAAVIRRHPRGWCPVTARR